MSDKNLEVLRATSSLTDEPLFDSLSKRLETLGRKLNKFRQSVERMHNT